jgi:capsular exopolysaccharide synthesis family protein
MSRLDQAFEKAAGTDVKPTEPASELILSGYPSEVADRKEPEIRNSNAGDAIAEPLLTQDSYAASLNPLLDGKLVGSDFMPAVTSDQYIRLSVALEQIRRVRPLRSVTVSSAERAEGKTLTAVNLALTLAGRSSGRVLLIDADLEAPSVHTIFQLPNTTGLSEVIGSTADRAPVVDVSPHLAVLTAGAPSSDPMMLLAAPRMKKLLQEAVAGFEWVVLDAPSVGSIDGSSLLAWLTDGTVLVVRAGRTAEAVVEQAILALGRDRVVGIVLNGSDAAV